MGPSHFILASALFAICASQRSPYAGRRPIGFPVIETTTLATTTVAAATVATATAQNNILGNRFDENSTAAATVAPAATAPAAATVTTTTERLPIEALGDRDLLNRLGNLPQDKQPFWYLNWQALDANRKQPQSYPLRPNSFAGTTAFPSNNGAANTQQPLQNNHGLVNPPLLSNQVVDNKRPFQNQPPFQNSPAVINNRQLRFRSAEKPEYSDEFDSEYY